jgi:ubiquinone biosynthesis monooxygenase Coq7
METAAGLKLGETLGDRVLKVNHAGEHGAVNIYRGQHFVSRWRSPDLLVGLRELQDHEERHRSIFSSELQRRHLRRCRSYHLCGLGGLLLGFVTGICGRRSIAATTVAVEAVVLKHLDGQLRDLRDTDPEACRAIGSIIEDERAHLNRAALEEQHGSLWPRLIRPVVSASTEAVIWLGMHI